MTTTDLQMLVQLGTVDDIECVALTDADHVAGGIPRWAELRLDIERDGKLLQHYFTRHDAEATSLALLKAMHPNAGKSISARLWEGIDEAMDGLLGRKLEEDDKLKTQGVALGLATCVALIRNPNAPDVDAVRKEAKERWEARHA
jgi:hypothetical protein